ncbi:MAG: [FeFe] hydrogenase H-cluster maturation GTPase HydF [Lachnospiraceae bacterium]|nr:[FeFe] hydrogenase H-cluster maturation GTPase HydF [Lachnospiraceae bacterium]
MGLNSTPSSDRIHIGFFGRRNAGKSSIVNAVTGQELAVVSEIKGTTTDPVQKAMELLPMGPAVIIDTPGIDDSGELGELRIRKTRQVLNKTDVAVLVVDGTAGISEAERQLAGLFQEKEIPFAVAMNKADLCVGELSESLQQIGSALGGEAVLAVSAKTGYQIQELKDKIAGLAVRREPDRRIVGDLIQPLDFVVLVTPIDDAAPKGRLILPQQQTIRDILESDAVAIVVKEWQLKETLRQLGKKPALVITDSQAFAKVHADTPKDVPLTSFSILFARYKGDLKAAVQGAAAIEGLQDGDKVLISEGCTHHRQCGDIGSVKIPHWLAGYTHKKLEIALTSGTEFPEDLSGYKLIIHCGGCMLNEREMKYRVKCAKDQGVPMTNYGIAIAYLQGILRRSIELFPDILAELPPN